MLTFAQEEWPDLKPVIMPLWERHWQEIAGDKDVIPLDPDWDGYDRLHQHGALKIMAAREDGELVGYVFAIVTPHLHYRTTLCSNYDLFWLAPEHRKGWAGYRLLKEAEKMLKACGVVKAFGQTKVWHDVTPIYKRMGWKPVETVFAKLLQEH